MPKSVLVGLTAGEHLSGDSVDNTFKCLKVEQSSFTCLVRKLCQPEADHREKGAGEVPGKSLSARPEKRKRRKTPSYPDA